MEIEAILDAWTTDASIDETDLSAESLNTPNLHSKYIRMLTTSRLKKLRLIENRKQAQQILREYYAGDLNNPADLESIGRSPNPKKILKQDLQLHVDSDKEMRDLNLKIGYLDETVKLLEDILKNIHIRGFAIKNSLDYQKFISGG
tara:strand:- start:277 stop:714 length:438 start_codon:yes stop_codon:yes gene_type:complete